MENNINDLENNIPNYYVNSAQITGGLYDFSINFKHLITEDNCTTSFNVTMSPQHAKSLLMVLHNTIRHYEETFGEISLSPKNQNPSSQE